MTKLISGLAALGLLGAELNIPYLIEKLQVGDGVRFKAQLAKATSSMATWDTLQLVVVLMAAPAIIKKLMPKMRIAGIPFLGAVSW